MLSPSLLKGPIHWPWPMTKIGPHCGYRADHWPYRVIFILFFILFFTFHIYPHIPLFTFTPSFSIYTSLPLSKNNEFRELNSLLESISSRQPTFQWEPILGHKPIFHWEPIPSRDSLLSQVVVVSRTLPGTYTNFPHFSSNAFVGASRPLTLQPTTNGAPEEEFIENGPITP